VNDNVKEFPIKKLVDHARDGAPNEIPAEHMPERPTVKSDLQDIHPQSVVDKTDIFAPLPANVEILDTVTRNDIPVDLVLRQAHEAKLIEAVIVGIDAEGNEYLFRNSADMAPSMWHLERGKYMLMRQMDEQYGETPAPKTKT